MRLEPSFSSLSPSALLSLFGIIISAVHDGSGGGGGGGGCGERGGHSLKRIKKEIK